VQFCVFSKFVKIDGGSAKSQKVESIPIDRLIEYKILWIDRKANEIG